MKKRNLIIAAILSLVINVNLFANTNENNYYPIKTEVIHENDLELEDWMLKSFEIESPKKEIIYVSSFLEYKLLSNVIKELNKIFPGEFDNIVIKFPNDFNEEELEIENWMTKPF